MGSMIVSPQIRQGKKREKKEKKLNKKDFFFQ